MEIKLKYSSYDSNEFMSLGKKSLNETVSVFNSYPWSEETAKIKNIKEQISYPTLKLAQENGEYAEINGFINNDQVFYNVKVKFKKITWRVIIGLQYNDKEILEFIKNYFSESTVKIINRIKSRRHTMNSFFIDFLVYSFGDKDKIVLFDKDAPRYFEYKLKGWRAFIKLFPSLIFLLMPLGFLVFSLVDRNPMSLGMFLILQIMIGAFGFPGLLIFINHLKKSKNIRLFFQKNNNKFILLKNSEKLVLDKTEIEKIDKYCTSANFKAPWSEFEYWEIHFKNGKSLNLPDMFINEKSFMKHFNVMVVDKDKKKRFLPLIK